jgi:hypothetical protein
LFTPTGYLATGYFPAPTPTGYLATPYLPSPATGYFPSPKGSVVALGGGPGGGDLVLDFGVGGQAEVGGALSGGVGLLEFGKQFAGEDLAFDAYGGVGHGLGGR